MNCFLTFPKILFGLTFKTLKVTVFESGLHSPTVTISPSLTLKQGEIWAAMFLCLFSYLLYFLMQCKQSLLMIMVFLILAEMQIPLKILPLIQTFPVNGHFLSIYVPSMASFGALKPKPTSLQYLTCFSLLDVNKALEFKKTPYCFQNAFSLCSAIFYTRFIKK